MDLKIGIIGWAILIGVAACSILSLIVWSYQRTRSIRRPQSGAKIQVNMTPLVQHSGGHSDFRLDTMTGTRLIDWSRFGSEAATSGNTSVEGLPCAGQKQKTAGCKKNR